MNKLQKYGLTAALAACVGLIGAGVVTGAESRTALAGKSDVVLGTLTADAVQTDVTIPETTSSGEGQEMSIADVAEEAMPSMVAITSKTVEEVQDYYSYYGYGSFFDDFFGNYGNGYGSRGNGNNGRSGNNNNTYTQESRGTGVIVAETDDDILIATNAHVIEGADELSVAFIDETAAPAEIMGSAEDDDLAVIKVAKSDLEADTLDAIKVIKFGTSGNLRVGEEVVAIGNALGYGQSVSYGIVSALNRMITTSENGVSSEYGPMIQTDASINPGNSGGALLNMKGELIGINSAKYASSSVEGMGYAIPIDKASPILTSLANGEEVISSRQNFLDEDGHVMLGVSVITLDDDAIAEMKEKYGDDGSYDNMPKGVLVVSVSAASPAERAGLEAGDILTAVDGKEIKTVDDLKAAIADYGIGDKVELTLSRESRGAFDRETSYQSGTLTVTFGYVAEDAPEEDEQSELAA